MGVSVPDESSVFGVMSGVLKLVHSLVCLHWSFYFLNE